jgi:hypothetical protein
VLVDLRFSHDPHLGLPRAWSDDSTTTKSLFTIACKLLLWVALFQGRSSEEEKNVVQ